MLSFFDSLEYHDENKRKGKKIERKSEFNPRANGRATTLTPSSYAKIERGETKMNIERLQQIANILNMDIKDFLDSDKNIVNLAIIGNNGDIAEQYQNCEISSNTQNLKIELKYKDQIIQEKNEKIKNLEREILSLQKIIELLEDKK